MGKGKKEMWVAVRVWFDCDAFVLMWVLLRCRRWRGYAFTKDEKEAVE